MPAVRQPCRDAYPRTLSDSPQVKVCVCENLCVPVKVKDRERGRGFIRNTILLLALPSCVYISLVI